MLRSDSLLRLHDQANTAWHDASLVDPPIDDLAAFLLAQHRANFDLWHEEDDARSPLATDARITQIKHSIDRLNQQRNDLVEQIDQYLLTLAASQNEAAPLHSETPGLIVDRLSILSLKIFHTSEETRRASATELHRQRNRERLALLIHQRSDLAQCLDELWAQVLSGHRRFHLYRQMKMYNDPDLNPAVYKTAPQT